VKLGEPSHPAPQSKPRCVFDAIIGADTEAPELRGKYRELVKRVRQGQAECDHSPTGGGFQSCVRIIGKKPAPTLFKMTTGTGRSTLIHPTKDRPVSIGEAKRLASFPDNFRMEGTFIQRWARIGNSVPPLFMRAIAQHIRREILHR
jgi:DNA (cytosine-5)-methyltransferase 1